MESLRRSDTQQIMDDIVDDLKKLNRSYTVIKEERDEKRNQRFQEAIIDNLNLLIAKTLDGDLNFGHSLGCEEIVTLSQFLSEAPITNISFDIGENVFTAEQTNKIVSNLSKSKTLLRVDGNLPVNGHNLLRKNTLYRNKNLALQSMESIRTLIDNDDNNDDKKFAQEVSVDTVWLLPAALYVWEKINIEDLTQKQSKSLAKQALEERGYFINIEGRSKLIEKILIQLDVDGIDTDKLEGEKKLFLDMVKHGVVRGEIKDSVPDKKGNEEVEEESDSTSNRPSVMNRNGGGAGGSRSPKAPMEDDLEI